MENKKTGLRVRWPDIQGIVEELQEGIEYERKKTKHIFIEHGRCVDLRIYQVSGKHSGCVHDSPKERAAILGRELIDQLPDNVKVALIQRIQRSLGLNKKINPHSKL
ncbi:MAG: hypothetical protein HYW77_01830 [Parcubacteria group bacterium]|nr:hypothetical protein [Parcubacteria group bacterium]